MNTLKLLTQLYIDSNEEILRHGYLNYTYMNIVFTELRLQKYNCTLDTFFN